MRNFLLFGESKLERMLNLMFYVSILIALISLAYALVFKLATKFYVAVFFNFAYAVTLLYLRNTYFGEAPKYEQLRKELSSDEKNKEQVDKYIKNIKEWDIFLDWLKVTIGLAIIYVFVIWLIP